MYFYTRMPTGFRKIITKILSKLSLTKIVGEEFTRCTFIYVLLGFSLIVPSALLEPHSPQSTDNKNGIDSGKIIIWPVVYLLIYLFIYIYADLRRTKDYFPLYDGGQHYDGGKQGWRQSDLLTFCHKWKGLWILCQISGKAFSSYHVKLKVHCS